MKALCAKTLLEKSVFTSFQQYQTHDGLISVFCLKNFNTKDSGWTFRLEDKDLRKAYIQKTDKPEVFDTRRNALQTALFWLSSLGGKSVCATLCKKSTSFYRPEFSNLVLSNQAYSSNNVASDGSWRFKTACFSQSDTEDLKRLKTWLETTELLTETFKTRQAAFRAFADQYNKTPPTQSFPGL